MGGAATAARCGVWRVALHCVYTSTPAGRGRLPAAGWAASTAVAGAGAGAGAGAAAAAAPAPAAAADTASIPADTASRTSGEVLQALLVLLCAATRGGSEATGQPVGMLR